MFTRDSLLKSDWYRRRLAEKRRRDIEHWQGFETRLLNFLADQTEADVARQSDLEERLVYVQQN